ncbi:TIGR03619 family F420-dependent LLM class oxidoreductase [Geodermatophilus sp. CPCC 205761]
MIGRRVDGLKPTTRSYECPRGGNTPDTHTAQQSCITAAQNVGPEGRAGELGNGDDRAATAGRARTSSRCSRDLAESDPVSGDLPLLGFGLPVSGGWATPDTMRRTARRAEELGYASLWTFQRVLYPADGELDRSHREVHDPVIPLAYVAGHTDRIGLGTATVCAPFTAPALLAKTLTSLDVLSGGRLTVGLGIGWLRQEYAAAGVPFERRGARMDEYVRCLEALWTQDPVEFAGEFFMVPRSHVGPRPVQRPHPAVLLGGAAAPALRRAGRLAQGWISSSRQNLTRIGECVETVRDGAREAGRDPEAVRILVRGLVDLVDEDPGAQRRPLQGTREQVLDDLGALRAQGVTEVFFDLNFSPRAGFPGVDAAAALAYADRVLDTFAPANGSS